MKHKPVIGIIGGGQLARMFIEEALRYNIDCIIVDADDQCPASSIAYDHIVGSIAEAAPLLKLGAITDVLTYDIEHIYIKPLFELEKQGKLLIPSPHILQIVQDKALQKNFYLDNNIPSAPFQLVSRPEEWKEVIWKKFVAKSRREGYDGRGVQIMTVDDLQNTINIPFEGVAILEEFIECKKEISIIVARNQHGDITCFPPVEMEFDSEANLVTMLLCPASINSELLTKANDLSVKIVEAMKGVGIFAVELFVDINDNIYVNEMAPRPHNSGHHTIEACYTSQYEQLLRILLDLPLGSTELIKPAVMINLLGPKEFSGSYYLHGYNEILKLPGVYVHLYGKATSRPMRKLGHITILGDTLADAKEKAIEVQHQVSIRSMNN
ncbi:MAG: 5-(carboxyamino)imidazole ribonucleotide synthase [Chitinophagales bacterium]|jgi:5-(carboxyamino)imidazole ribonucleotide synthase|nr:5-(carboxyamino)imidazole ribonucleotide synthase [Chitinophagales bacterium]